MTVLNLARALIEELDHLSHGTAPRGVPWDSGSHAAAGTSERRIPPGQPGRLGQSGQRGPDVAAVLERAAVLEFCKGLPRGDADRRALGEAGFSSWEALATAKRGAELADTRHERMATVAQTGAPVAEQLAGDTRWKIAG